jgi:long-chain acyl-CoA synthetase
MTRPAPGTLAQLFFDAALGYDKPDALQVKRDGAYRPISHRTLLERVRHVAFGLAAIGVRPGDRVAILSENRPEWAIADFACLTSGIPNVPLYPSLPAARLLPLLSDSGVVAAFVSTPEQVRKIAALRAQVPALRSVIAFTEAVPDGADLTLSDLEALGRARDGPEAAARYRDAARAIGPDDLATVIYTSGTSGEPKGAMLTHDNIASNVAAARTVLDFPGNDVSLSFLPLSHIFERMGGHYLMFAVGASICYAESLVSLSENFAEVRPTFVMAVPRIYETIYAAAWQQATTRGVLARTVFRWACAVATRWTDVRSTGRRAGPWLALQHAAADRLLFARLRARMGGKIRYFVSGGAPLAVEINKFFYAAGIVILEGYGLTETAPVIAVNTPAHFRIGTVGHAFAGVEVRIAPDGEILCRGPGVMRGYLNQPEATRAAIDADGWFHTGDIGESRDGFLSITDRKKDLIITSAGKNIAPQPIENRIRESRYVSQVMMVGDRRPYPVLLVVPNMDALAAWAAAHAIVWQTPAALVADPAVRRHVERDVLGRLTGVAAYERPRRMAILDHAFTIDAGELTPKLSIMRHAVVARYADVIEAMYAKGDS